MCVFVAQKKFFLNYKQLQHYAGNFNVNEILDLTESSSSSSSVVQLILSTSPSSILSTSTLISSTTSTSSNRLSHQHQKIQQQHQQQQQLVNVDVLHLVNVTESKNFTCQAQNSFGLVVFNLTLVIKGNLTYFLFLCFCSQFLSLCVKY